MSRYAARIVSLLQDVNSTRQADILHTRFTNPRVYSMRVRLVVNLAHPIVSPSVLR